MPRETPVYLDCAATTPMEPEVLEVVIKYMRDEYGNAGSRTHEFGARAKQAIERAREQVAAVVNAQPEEVIFTSGATESNNLAILGLRAEGLRTGRRHIVTTMIEHKSVLEPIAEMTREGFEVTLIRPEPGGSVDARKVRSACRDDTLLVSVMAVNNETGVVQPLDDIVRSLQSHDAYIHVDAAQAFGKCVAPLDDPRIDLLSVSGHKVFAPKGVGALVCKRRGTKYPPLSPLMFGGGQERQLRPGTLPVALIAGLGHAAQMAAHTFDLRNSQCSAHKQRAVTALAPLSYVDNADTSLAVPWIMNVSLPGIDSEAAMVTLKGIAAVSTGSACTSANYTLSHVLQAMNLPEDQINSTIRISWSHLTGSVDWHQITHRLQSLL